MGKGLSSLADFKAKFTSVRPNRFKVEFPQTWESKLYKDTWIPADKAKDIYIYCKSASLPSSRLNTIQIPYLGRMYYDSGDREFFPLSLTFYNSQDFALRNFFEEWMNNINLNKQNYQIANSSSEKGQSTVSKDFDIFMDQLTVSQLDRRDNVIKAYRFFGVFPTECGEIRLDFGDSDAIETFDVTLQYQWWETDETNAEIPGTGDSPTSTSPSDSEIWRGGGGGNGWTIISPTWTPNGVTRGGTTR